MHQGGYILALRVTALVFFNEFQTVADNIHDVHEFGDLPPSLLNRLSQILSKRRVLDSRTLDLFLRPGLDTVDVYDCGSKSMITYFTPFQPNLKLDRA